MQRICVFGFTKRNSFYLFAIHYLLFFFISCANLLIKTVISYIIDRFFVFSFGNKGIFITVAVEYK